VFPRLNQTIYWLSSFNNMYPFESKGHFYEIKVKSNFIQALLIQSDKNDWI